MKLNFTIIIKNLLKHIFIISKYKNMSNGNEEKISQCEQLNCDKLEMNLKNMPLNDLYDLEHNLCQIWNKNLDKSKTKDEQQELDTKALNIWNEVCDDELDDITINDFDFLLTQVSKSIYKRDKNPFGDCENCHAVIIKRKRQRHIIRNYLMK